MLTFHLSRCTCHVPRANVKNGMMPTRTIVGVSHGYRRAFWLGGWGAAVVDSLRTPVRRRRLVFRRKKEDRKEDNMMPISQWRVCIIRGRVRQLPRNWKCFVRWEYHTSALKHSQYSDSRVEARRIVAYFYRRPVLWAPDLDGMNDARLGSTLYKAPGAFPWAENFNGRVESLHFIQ